jgi:MarR family transcriptional regulator, lower aerobic nicotinate degradation pathway regulator
LVLFSTFVFDMKKYGVLQELIGAYGDYETDMGHAPKNLTQFARWLSLRTAQQEVAAPRSGAETIEVTIGRIVTFLTRYTKLYAKKALEGSELGSIDEFVYLTYLFFRRGVEISKMELIRANRHEKPTGMEIIRRLTALGLVEQKPSSADKRSTVLQITPAGMQALPPILERMTVVSQTLVGDLTLEEKTQLAGLLEKLEHYHQDLLGRLDPDWELNDLIEHKN